MAAAAPNAIVLAIRGPVVRSDLTGLCNRICGLLTRHRPSIAICDVRGVDADAVTVDALARLQFAARRHGCRVHLRRASPELVGLVAFMGLADVLVDE